MYPIHLVMSLINSLSNFSFNSQQDMNLIFLVIKSSNNMSCLSTVHENFLFIVSLVDFFISLSGDIKLFSDCDFNCSCMILHHHLTMVASTMDRFEDGVEEIWFILCLSWLIFLFIENVVYYNWKDFLTFLFVHFLLCRFMEICISGTRVIEIVCLEGVEEIW